MSEQKTNNKKPAGNRISLGLLILSAVVFGFISGLGGSLLLSHSLIRRPLQEQQEENKRLFLKHEQQFQVVAGELDTCFQDLQKLQARVRFISGRDSLSLASRLSRLENAHLQNERAVLKRLTRLEQRVKELNNTYKGFAKDVDRAKVQLDASDKSLKEELRELKSAVNELENKLAQLQQRLDLK